MARSPLADAESEELNRNFEKLSLSSGAVVGTRKTTKQNTPVTTASKYAVIGVDAISGQFSILPALYDTEAQASEVSEGLKTESVSVVVVPTQTWMPIKALSDMVGKKVPKTRSKAVESEEKITKAPKKDSGKESVGSSSEAKKKEKQATDEKPRRKEGGPLIKVDETKLARYEELVKAEESNIAAYETLPPIDYKGWEMKLGPIKEVLKEKIKDLKNALQEVDGDLASKLKPSLQSYLDIVASLRSFAHSAKGHPCAGGLARALGRIKKHSNWTHHGENETGGEKYIITNTNQVLMLRDVSNIVQTIVKRQRLLRQIETSMAVQGQKGVYFTVYAEQEHLCIDLQKIFTGQGEDNKGNISAAEEAIREWARWEAWEVGRMRGRMSQLRDGRILLPAVDTILAKAWPRCRDSVPALDYTSLEIITVGDEKRFALPKGAMGGCGSKLMPGGAGGEEIRGKEGGGVEYGADEMGAEATPASRCSTPAAQSAGPATPTSQSTTTTTPTSQSPSTNTTPTSQSTTNTTSPAQSSATNKTSPTQSAPTTSMHNQSCTATTQPTRLSSSSIDRSQTRLTNQNAPSRNQPNPSWRDFGRLPSNYRINPRESWPGQEPPRKEWTPPPPPPPPSQPAMQPDYVPGYEYDYPPHHNNHYADRRDSRDLYPMEDPLIRFRTEVVDMVQYHLQGFIDTNYQPGSLAYVDVGSVARQLTEWIVDTHERMRDFTTDERLNQAVKKMVCGEAWGLIANAPRFYR